MKKALPLLLLPALTATATWLLCRRRHKQVAGELWRMNRHLWQEYQALLRQQP